jgi:hypothetical protein
MFSKFSISFSAARLAARSACCFPGAFLSQNQRLLAQQDVQVNSFSRVKLLSGRGSRQVRKARCLR